MPAGTIALTNNSTTVTGTGTSFTTELKVNDFVVAVVGGVAYTLGVAAIASNTSLTLIQKYDGPTTSGLTWNPVPFGTMTAITAQLAAQVTYAIRGLNLDKNNWQGFYTATGNMTINLPDGNSVTGPSWPAMQKSISDGLTGKAASGSNNDITELKGLTTALSIAQGGTGAKTKADAATGIGVGTGDSPTFTGANVKAATPTYAFSFGNSASPTASFIQYEAATVALTGANLRAPSFKIGNGANGTLTFANYSGVGSNSIDGGPFYPIQGILSSNGSGSTSANRYAWFWNGTMNLFVDGANKGYLSLNTSDRNLKKDITEADPEEDIAAIRKLAPVSFYWKEDVDTTMQRGFIAQDAYAVAPDLAMESLDLWGLKQYGVMSRTVGAVKYLDSVLQKQDDMIKNQSAIIDELQKRLKALDGLDA